MNENDLLQELLTRASHLQLEFAEEFLKLCPNIDFQQLLINMPVLLFLGNCVVSQISFEDSMKILLNMEAMKHNYEKIKKGITKIHEQSN